MQPEEPRARLAPEAPREVQLPEEVTIFLSFIGVVIGGVVLMIAAMNNRRRIREMAHKERLAMIERGLIPSPESDPAGFEAAMGTPAAGRGPVPGERYRTIGVVLIGLGVGMGLLIGMAAGAEEVAIGVGGAWVALGGASLLNYLLITQRR